MTDPQGKAGIAQIMQQFPLHLGDQVARGTVAQGGVEINRALAESHVGRTKEVLEGNRPAESKTLSLLMGQAQVLTSKGALSARHRTARASWHSSVVQVREAMGTGGDQTKEPPNSIPSFQIIQGCRLKVATPKALLNWQAHVSGG